MAQLQISNFNNKKFFITIFFIAFTLFLFTNDGHRYTHDEDIAQQQTKWLVIQEPHDDFKEGISTADVSFVAKRAGYPICKEPLLCSPINIGHTVLEYPFVFLNHHFEIITTKTLVLTLDDFADGHYITWRNSQDPDFTFMELLYGPIFSALSVATFFLITRIFSYKITTSIILTVIFLLSTMVWAYSQTSFNLLSSTFFLLLGTMYFLRHIQNSSNLSLILCGISIGIAFLIRTDAILIGSIIGIYLIGNVIYKKNPKQLISYFLPSIGFLFLFRIIDYFRFESNSVQGAAYIPSHSFPFYIGIPGMLFSPGVGVFIFYPILITCFVSFVDFFKKHKIETCFFITILAVYLIFYGTGVHWHAMNGWADRYLMATIPFFLIPLGASIEKRIHILFRTSVIILSFIGLLSNLVYVIQDHNWFVWGLWGSDAGLTSLGSGLNLHPATLWTFEYSQLTHSFIVAFSNLQHDIFLLRLFGTEFYSILLVVIMSICSFLLYRFSISTSNYHLKH